MKLCYSVIETNFSTEGLYSILDEAVQKNAEAVVLFSETEWEIPCLTKEIVQAYKNKNIEICIVYCSNYDEYYEKLLPELGLTKDNISFWGTYWLSWSKENLKWIDAYKNFNFDSNNIKYPFITLNNRSHLHRCAFIDELCKQNLIDKGIVTWVKHLNENANYPYKHFDNRQILLDDDFATKLDSFLLPKEFNQSLFHVVTEATHKTAFISEKTAIPLFMRKPFFVLSAPHYHKHLVDLGYKLYDEIIDYSFDSVEDLYLRTEMFVSNIHKILPLDYKEVYETLKPKLEYNYKRTIEIIHDIKYIPKIIQERNFETKGKPSIHSDFRYNMFIKQCLAND